MSKKVKKRFECLGILCIWFCFIGASFGQERVEQSESYQGASDIPRSVQIVSPLNGETDVSINPNLRVRVTDIGSDPVDVTFYARTSGGENFTLIHWSDTQFYAQDYPGTFTRLAQWLHDNRDSLNTEYICISGDVVNNGGEIAQWENADAAMQIIEEPILPNFLNGIPYGISIGNFDEYPDGTGNYNAYFGIQRFEGRSYYGGNFNRMDNDNHFALFSAGGMDFIVIYLEWDLIPQAVYWADALLSTYSNRRGIVVHHYITEVGEQASFSPQGQMIYNGLKENPNLFLMLSGHVYGEGKRVDVFNGNTAYTLLANYQALPNGGNGWLRLMEFFPAEDEIQVQTYSPTLDMNGTDLVMGENTKSEEFVLSYDMDDVGGFTSLGTVQGITNGSEAVLYLPDCDSSKTYEWYVEVSNGQPTEQGPIWSFTTVEPTVNIPPTVWISGPTDGSSSGIGETIVITAEAYDTDGSIVRVEFYEGQTKLGEDNTAPFEWTWTDVTKGGYSLTAVTIDDKGTSTTSGAVSVIVQETEHFQPVLNTGITRPVQIDTAWLKIDGTDVKLDSADEIAVFDGELCVGAARVVPHTEPQILGDLFPVTFATILQVITPIDTLPGAIAGRPMSFRIWDESTNTEAEAVVVYNQGGIFGNFLTVATSLRANVVTINIQTDPPGINFPIYVDNQEYIGSQSLKLSVDSTYAFSVDSLPVIAGLPSGHRYRFNEWTNAVTYGAKTYNYKVLPSSETITVHFNKQFELTVNTDYGTTTGQGWYDSLTVVNFQVDSDTLTVGPGIIRLFNQWTGTGDNSYTGSLNPGQVTMNNPITEHASWIVQYNLSTSTNPYAGGNVTLSPPGGWYTYGTPVLVSATATTGYQWSHWTGDIVSNFNPISVTVDGPKSMTANFDKVFEITVGAQPSGMAFRVDGVTHYSDSTFIWVEGSQHSLSVDSLLLGTNTRFAYTAWSDGGGRSHTYIVPSANQTVTAIFKTQYLLNLNPNLVYTTATGTGWYDAGTYAIFKIASTDVSGGPGIRYLFTGWTSNDPGGYSGPLDSTRVKMDNPITETATWDAQFYLSTTENPDEGGDITQGPVPPGAWYAAEDSVVLDATPAAGYQWAGWTGDLLTTTKPETIHMTGPKTIIANFGQEVQVTIQTQPPNLEFSADATIYNTTHTFIWIQGSPHPVAVESPQAGVTGTQYVFESWSDGGDTSHTYIVPTTGDTLTANFKTQHLLTVTSDSSTAYGAGWYDEGTNASFWISPMIVPLGSEKRLFFSSWQGSGVGSYTGPDTSHTVTMNNPITELAVWNTQYKLSVSSQHGTTTGEGWYNAGTNVNFSVAPTTVSGAEGIRYIFNGWTGSGGGSYTSPDSTGTDSTNTVTMNNPITENAGWTTQYYLITDENPDEGGNITPMPPGGWYDAGAVVQVNAVSALGFLWAGWSGSIVGTTRPVNITMNEPKYVTANFGNETQVTITTQPIGLVYTVDGIAYDTTRTFNWIENSQHELAVASPQAAGVGTRYVYTSWSDGGNQSHMYSVPVSGDTIVIANFAKQYLLTVDSEHGFDNGAGWYYEGSEARFSVDVQTVPAGLGRQFVFNGWQGSGTGSYTGSDTAHTVTMNNPITEQADWQKQFRLWVNSEYGSTTGDGWYNEGTITTFSVGSTALFIDVGIRRFFTGWIGTGGNNSYTGPDSAHSVTMDTAITEDATWHSQYLLTTDEDPDEGGNITPAPPGAWYDSGTEVEISAVAVIGYHWSGWSGDLSSNENPDTLLMNGPKVVTANFGREVQITVKTTPFQLPFIVDDSTHYISQTFTWIEGTEHTLSVYSPHDVIQGTRKGFKFWSNGGDQTQLYTVPGVSDTVIATFATQHLLTLNSIYATTIGGGWYDDGGAATFSVYPTFIQVQPGIRHQFSQWQGTGVGSYTGPDTAHTVIMNNPITETAIWNTLNNLTLTTNVVPLNSGTIQVLPGLGDLYANTWVTVIAVPASGYFFDHWEGAATGTNDTTHFVIVSNTSVTAHFSNVDTSPPYVYDAYPWNEAIMVARNNGLEFKVRDDLNTVDISSLNVRVSGTPIIEHGYDQTDGRVSITSVTNGYRIGYNPTTPFPASTSIPVEVYCTDNAQPANNTLDHYTYSFTTGTMMILYTTMIIVTPAGITVQDTSGIIIVIPPNALLNPTTITLGQIVNFPSFPDSVTGVGPVYSFGPYGFQFTTDVEIRIPISSLDFVNAGVASLDDLKILGYNPTTGKWEEIPSTIDKTNMMVTFSVTQLSHFRLVASIQAASQLTVDGFAEIYNYPNPFNPDQTFTNIVYKLRNNSDVTLKILDVSGRSVIILEDNVARSALRNYVCQWDGRNGRGDIVSNNVYFCILETGDGQRKVRKIGVLR